MAPRKLAPKSPLSSLDILVADNSAHMADLLVSAVKSIGVRTATKAANTSAALAALKSRKFDVAILDFDLRPKGAIELVLALRRSHLKQAHIPVIGLATSGSPEVLKAAMFAGLNKVIVKPVSGDTLRARLLEIVEGQSSPMARGTAPDLVEI